MTMTVAVENGAVTLKHPPNATDNAAKTLAFRGGASVCAARSSTDGRGVGAGDDDGPSAAQKQSTRLGRVIRKPAKLEEIPPGPQRGSRRGARSDPDANVSGKKTKLRDRSTSAEGSSRARRFMEAAACNAAAASRSETITRSEAAATAHHKRQQQLLYSYRVVSSSVAHKRQREMCTVEGSTTTSGTDVVPFCGNRHREAEESTGIVAERSVARFGTLANRSDDGGGNSGVSARSSLTKLVIPAAAAAAAAASTTSSESTIPSNNVDNKAKAGGMSGGDGGGGGGSSRDASSKSSSVLNPSVARTALGTGRAAAAIMASSTVGTTGKSSRAAGASRGTAADGGGSGSGGDLGGKGRKGRLEEAAVAASVPSERPIGSMGIDPEATMREYKRVIDDVRILDDRRFLCRPVVGVGDPTGCVEGIKEARRGIRVFPILWELLCGAVMMFVVQRLRWSSPPFLFRFVIHLVVDVRLMDGCFPLSGNKYGFLDNCRVTRC